MDEMKENKDLCIGIEISDGDIFEAMKDMRGYLDVTPGDLKEIYKFAYRHAHDRIMKSVKARDIMTREVITVGRLTPLDEVAGVMASGGISGVPVLEDDGTIAGVISGKDFLTSMGAKDKMNFMAVIAECLKGRKCVSMPVSRKKAEDIMTSPAITVEENTAVSEIAAIFSSKKINRVPVVDQSGTIIGIVSRADIVCSFPVRIKP